MAAAIELATIEQLKTLLQLPTDFSGSFVSGATMANFTGIAIGRQWLGQQRDRCGAAWLGRLGANSGPFPPMPMPAA